MLLLFDESERPSKKGLDEILALLAEDYANRGIELREVSSGFRFQVRKEMGPWVSRLWQEKPPRYSRAILETLALIAYRQPITRGEIEEIRGVAVNTQIVRTLLERNWVRVVGHRDVPGRPAMYATTRQFLDYFDLKSLEDLPPLSEIRDLDKINEELQLEEDKRVAEVLAEQGEGDDAAGDESRQTTIMDAINNEPEIDESTLMSLDQVDAVLSGFEAEFRKKPSVKQEEQADADNTTPDMLEEDISGEDDNEPTHE
jgi:segregation and condensation protein B